MLQHNAHNIVCIAMHDATMRLTVRAHAQPFGSIKDFADCCRQRQVAGGSHAWQLCALVLWSVSGTFSTVLLCLTMRGCANSALLVAPRSYSTVFLVGHWVVSTVYCQRGLYPILLDSCKGMIPACVRSSNMVCPHWLLGSPFYGCP